MIEEDKGKGGVQSVIDQRDYQYSDIASASKPFDWDKGFDIEEELGRKLIIKDQGSSDSCGGQAWGYYGQVLDPDFEEKSAHFIYSQTNVAGGGSSGRANSDIVKNEGWGSEKLTPSYKNGRPMTEAEYIKHDITSQAFANAMKDKALSYASVMSYNIEDIAKAIRDQKGCILLVQGQNNGTWLSAFPKPPVGNSNIWRHWLYFGKAKLINGVKYIGFINSWGEDVGEKGWQWLSEDYLIHTLESWTLIYDNQMIISTLRKGSRGDQVKLLQQFLGGLVVDGAFGSLTDGKVREFQRENNLVVDGIVGPITRKIINNK